MYYNNLNRQQDDDDLKFIPLNIKEPFLDKDSNWFPIVNMTSPNISGMTNNFMSGFATPMANGNIDDNLLKTIEYIPDIKYSYTDEDKLNTYYTNNTSNNMNGRNNNLNNMSESSYNQNYWQGNIDGYMYNNILSRNSFNSMSNVTPQNTPGTNNQSNFNLNYPAETESGELHSYNKDIGCNKNLKTMTPSGTSISPGGTGMAPSGTGTSPGSTGMAPGGMGTSPGSTGMAPSGMGTSQGSTGMTTSGMGTS